MCFKPGVKSKVVPEDENGELKEADLTRDDQKKEWNNAESEIYFSGKVMHFVMRDL